jgi:dienelactone hydrolase
MKRLCTICLFLAFLAADLEAQSDPTSFTGETIKFSSGDGIRVTADLYMTPNPKAPMIILYHQARYSRGEYRQIAPKLNEMGFNCLAVDQRSGDSVNGVDNETHREALENQLPTEYLDAITDIEAAYVYVKHGLKPDKIILWGSSYSAALMFYMGSGHHDNLSGILAFSPAEYFKVNGRPISSFAERVTAPVFVTSSRTEHADWKSIYEAIPGEKRSFLPENEGRHGSKALWSDNPGHELYWNAVEEFLDRIKSDR